MINFSCRKVYFYLTILLFIWSCKKENCDILEYHPNGNEKAVACLEGDLYLIKEYDKNQNLHATYYLDENAKHQGEMTFFRKNGDILEIGTYKDDDRAGWFLKYNGLGEVISRSFYGKNKIIFSEKYLKKDTVRLFLPEIDIKEIILRDKKVNVKLEFIFPLADTSINLRNVVYKAGLKRYDSERDTMFYGFQDTTISVEKENYPKLVSLLFETENPPVFYYYMVDTTRNDIVEPPEIDLLAHLLNK